MTTAEITTKAKEYRELQAMIRELETSAEAVKAVLIAEMESRGADMLQVDIFTIKYTTYTSNRIDTAALKNELPDIAARYTRVTESKRFQVA